MTSVHDNPNREGRCSCVQAFAGFPRRMAGMVAQAVAPVAANLCPSRLRARQQSSRSASCSYTPAPSRVLSRHSRVATKAAESDVAEFEEDEQDAEDPPTESLPPDILKLLAPRTKPTPLLTPQEVGECFRMPSVVWQLFCHWNSSNS